jgi:hypothetical protein
MTPVRLPWAAAAAGSWLAGTFADAVHRKTQTTSNTNVAADAAGIPQSGREGQKARAPIHHNPPKSVRIAAPPTSPRIRAFVSSELMLIMSPDDFTPSLYIRNGGRGAACGVWLHLTGCSAANRDRPECNVTRHLRVCSAPRAGVLWRIIVALLMDALLWVNYGHIGRHALFWASALRTRPSTTEFGPLRWRSAPPEPRWKVLS